MYSEFNLGLRIRRKFIRKAGIKDEVIFYMCPCA